MMKPLNSSFHSESKHYREVLERNENEYICYPNTRRRRRLCAVIDGRHCDYIYEGKNV